MCIKDALTLLITIQQLQLRQKYNVGQSFRACNKLWQIVENYYLSLRINFFLVGYANCKRKTGIDLSLFNAYGNPKADVLITFDIVRSHHINHIWVAYTFNTKPAASASSSSTFFPPTAYFRCKSQFKKTTLFYPFLDLPFVTLHSEKPMRRQIWNYSSNHRISKFGNRLMFNMRNAIIYSWNISSGLTEIVPAFTCDWRV